MSSRSWFSALLLPWYRAARRPLPWRETKPPAGCLADPYRVWLSEVILQQTRVEQGLPYYLRFVRKWPTVKRLAAADEQEVLKAWQGLGYYSRARNLLAAARQVVQQHGGRFPGTHAQLMGLKGVGDYTASAIASICFGRPDAVVDGNVYRVLARVFGLELAIDSTAGKQAFKALAGELLDPGQPGDHNQAVMELGATVCTPKNPDCRHCPLHARCTALATGTVQRLPVKAGKAKSRDRYFNYLHIAAGNGIYMQQRTGKDIWQGLHELPLLESARPLTARALKAKLDRTLGAGWSVARTEMEQRHVLSHQVIHAAFWAVGPPEHAALPPHWARMSLRQARGLAVPRPIERWFQREA